MSITNAKTGRTKQESLSYGIIHKLRDFSIQYNCYSGMLCLVCGILFLALLHEDAERNKYDKDTIGCVGHALGLSD